MRIPNWLRSLVTRLDRTRARRPSHRRAARPRVAELEARVTPARFVVTTTGDSGAGSLRQPILDANAAAGPDTISFALPDSLKSPGGDWWTIQPPTGLPSLTDSVIVDGWSQGGVGYSGPPLIVIDGTLS